MLVLSAAALIVLWFLGVVSSYTLGGSIHFLLAVALALFLMHLIRDRQRS